VRVKQDLEYGEFGPHLTFKKECCYFLFFKGLAHFYNVEVVTGGTGWVVNCDDFGIIFVITWILWVCLIIVCGPLLALIYYAMMLCRYR
jgi:hypothetical protein